MQQTQQTTAPVQNSFWAGFHDGVPIGLGYLSVSVTFGMMAVTGGLCTAIALGLVAFDIFILVRMRPFAR